MSSEASLQQRQKSKGEEYTTMKVLMYGWEFPPFISGGLGIACYGIVQGLLHLHVDISLVLPYIGNSLPDNKRLQLTHVLEDSPNSGHIDIRPVRTILRPYITEQRYRQLQEAALPNSPYGENLWAEVHRYAREAGELARTTPHDVIHAHDWLTILAGIHAKKISGKPLIFHIHALEIDRCGDHPCQAVFGLEQYGMQQADKIIAVSQYTKNIIVEQYGIPAEKIAVVHNGLSECPEEGAPFPTKKSRYIVLFLGRITHQKGPYFFVETAKKVLAKRKDVQFVMAGEGDQLHDMIEQVASAGLSPYFHFTGFLNHELVQKMYRMSDVYVMPSVSEPFGLSCLEAASHDVPVIISKQSGVSEVLNNSLKADFWDTDKFAHYILACLNYPALRHALSQNARQELEELSWEKAAEKIVKVYEESEPRA